MSPHIQGDALEHLDRDSFTGVVGTGFKVSQGQGTDAIWLRLLSIDDFTLTPVNTDSMAVSPKTSGVQPTTTVFGLVFLGPSSQPLKQGTYVFEHIKLGTFQLFIVPNGQSQDTYTAVINRLDVIQNVTGGGAQTIVPVTPMPLTTPAAVITPPAVVPATASTSSGNGLPSLEREQTPAVQRGATRD